MRAGIVLAGTLLGILAGSALGVIYGHVTGDGGEWVNFVPDVLTLPFNLWRVVLDFFSDDLGSSVLRERVQMGIIVLGALVGFLMSMDRALGPPRHATTGQFRPR